MEELNELTIDDLKFIKESLQYTKHNFENYTKYPDQDYKQKRIAEAGEVLAKFNDLLKKRKSKV